MQLQMRFFYPGFYNSFAKSANRPNDNYQLGLGGTRARVQRILLGQKPSLRGEIRGSNHFYHSIAVCLRRIFCRSGFGLLPAEVYCKPPAGQCNKSDNVWNTERD